MNCVVCGGKVVDGRYIEFGICGECERVIDDIIAAYFERLTRDLEIDGEAPYYIYMLSRKLKFLEQTMWWHAYDEMLQKGKSDDEYFMRLEKAIKWFDSNPDIVKKIGEKFFAKCNSCGKELIPGSVVVEQVNGSFIVKCNSCGDVIVSCIVCKRLNE
ncbi:hypothetical protein [Archaeoglobus sulfaticallidus]|nr:hypothetical protein [Archaeoglobus sulfaticallidus]